MHKILQIMLCLSMSSIVGAVEHRTMKSPHYYSYPSTETLTAQTRVSKLSGGGSIDIDGTSELTLTGQEEGMPSAGVLFFQENIVPILLVVSVGIVAYVVLVTSNSKKATLKSGEPAVALGLGKPTRPQSLRARIEQAVNQKLAKDGVSPDWTFPSKRAFFYLFSNDQYQQIVKEQKTAYSTEFENYRRAVAAKAAAEDTKYRQKFKEQMIAKAIAQAAREGINPDAGLRPLKRLFLGLFDNQKIEPAAGPTMAANPATPVAG